MNNLDDYQAAQGHWSWVSAADQLTASGNDLFFAAANHKPRYDQASDEAEERAQQKLDKSGDDHAIEMIECEAPRFLPAFLLYGFAIEDLLKGLYVLRNPDAISRDRVKIPTHHELAELAQAAGYGPTDGERKLMYKLSTITTWSGRYPVAKTRHQHGSHGLWREAIFQDPVEAGIASQALIKKLRLLVKPGPVDRRGGAVVVWR